MVTPEYKIAITGKANTGKNTLAKMITKCFRQEKGNHLTVSYMAFATPIKKMAEQMFPTLPKKFLYGSSKYRDQVIPGAFKDGKPLTVRQLLLDLGTAVGRGYKDDIWLDNFQHKLSKVHSDLLIVTDCRFRNEFDFLENMGFYQVRLYRDTGSPTINHKSETGQDLIEDGEFDSVIHNDKTLSWLREEVKKEIILNII